jgi:hypothetical protein
MNKYTSEEERFLVDHYPTGGSRYCADRLGKSMNSVYLKANRMGLKVIVNVNKGVTRPQQSAKMKKLYIEGKLKGTFKPVHGKRKHPMYSTWRNMLRRCYDKKAPDYPRYGGRGVGVCEEWLSVNGFIEWADNSGRKQGLTLDRINNDGNYEPTNCRWATHKEQSLNSTRSNLHTFNGVTDSLHGWAKTQGLKYNTVVSRVRYGWPVEKALGIYLDD